jgi:hypothetical protein
MDCQEQKHIETSYNLVLEWQWKRLLEFWKEMENLNEKTWYAIMKSIECDYNLHLLS